MKLLFEGDVIKAVCNELVRRGYRIEQELDPTQRGDDIIAINEANPSSRLIIEAKGESSSRKNSRRYGQAFSSAQVRVHVAEVIYKAAEILSRPIEGDRVLVGVAFPDNATHRRVVTAISHAVARLEIAVFWVNKHKEVEIQSSWLV